LNIFLTGASGYIGGSVAWHLIQAGHSVRGLVRSADKTAQLRAMGIEPIVGSLDDTDLLAQEAKNADAVVNAAQADHARAVQVFVNAMAGSGKVLLHTSGSSVIGDASRGAHASDAVFDEDTPFIVLPAKQARRAVELAVLDAAQRGVRSAVMCPSLIYGQGRGIHAESVQVPTLVRNAKACGVVQVVGEGRNIWSNVHIDDVAALYVLALCAQAQDQAAPGAYYFAEGGEASFGQMADAVARRLSLGPVQHLPVEEAARRWGESMAHFTMGCNSRVRARRARVELGWVPQHTSVLTWIAQEMPV
jgi:nucleoside-diphosphate-sugar epimerase